MSIKSNLFIYIRDGPLENLWGVGQVEKNIRAREYEMKTIHARQLTLKKNSCYGLKKIHTRDLITKKIAATRKFPTPPPPAP